MSTSWHPIWWNESNDSAWARIKEAVRRDWEQTKYDLDLPGGHQLNQNAGDTIKQAADLQAIPADDAPNPPRVIGTWDEAEDLIGFGYAARQRYGTAHPAWNDQVEKVLREEWQHGRMRTQGAWRDVRRWVRHGYEYKQGR